MLSVQANGRYGGKQENSVEDSLNCALHYRQEVGENQGFSSLENVLAVRGRSVSGVKSFAEVVVHVDPIAPGRQGREFGKKSHHGAGSRNRTGGGKEVAAYQWVVMDVIPIVSDLEGRKFIVSNFSGNLVRDFESNG